MCLWVTFYQFSRILRKFLIKSSSPENLSNIQLNFFSRLKTVKGSFFFVYVRISNPSSKLCVHFIRSVISSNINLLIVSSWLYPLYLMWWFGFSILILASQIHKSHIYMYIMCIYIYINPYMCTSNFWHIYARSSFQYYLRDDPS